MRLLSPLLAIPLLGCSVGMYHGETKFTSVDGDITETFYHGWDGVIGQGITSTASGPEGAIRDTANTGFSDNAAPVMDAFGGAAGDIGSAIVGTKAIGAVGGAVAERINDREEPE